jgi:AraC-like DNA-binding protein
MRVQDEAPLTVVCLVQGDAVISLDDGTVERLGDGDVAIIRGPNPYTMADREDTAVRIVIHPGQRCETLLGEPLAEAMGLGVRTWGNDLHGSTVMLTGTYLTDGELTRPLLDVLPEIIVLRDREWSSAAAMLLADQIAVEGAGQEAVLDRLLDVIVVTGLRAWFSRPGNEAPGWFRGQDDPVIGPALRAMHESPEEPWTVASIAESVGVSRAALARRFVDVVGDTPIAYLTSLRLALAADLLVDSSRTIGQVASGVGYGSPFALSAAFKRAYGASPRDYRRTRRQRPGPRSTAQARVGSTRSDHDLGPSRVEPVRRQQVVEQDELHDAQRFAAHARFDHPEAVGQFIVDAE